MADQQPNLDSLFLSALQIASLEERATFLKQSCGDDESLLNEVERMLASHQAAGSFLEKPAVDLFATLAPSTASQDLAAALQAGLSPAFREGEAVVIGSAGHSVLKAMGQTIDIPRVVLRDEAGNEPIVRPRTPEIPYHDSDGRYQVQGEIARGGMGAILRGRDMDLGRDLAIKVLLDAHKDSPEVVQRFVEEAQIGGQLQHPGIAPIYELGQFADKRPFFSMKLVKGETLSKLLADRENAAQERGKFIGIFEQICQTMAYAHSRGVIHRDLKPANIMVGAFGEVQVMDWGLAKVLQAGGVADEKKAFTKSIDISVIQTGRSGIGSDLPGKFGTVGSHTQMGSVMGTLAYMPPEQALGEIDLMDERADVFGLGAILCEILTGKPPYVGNDGNQVYRMASRGKLSDCFERLAACGADEDLIALAKHCLELEPRDRPRNAEALTKRVTGYLESVEMRLREAEVQRAAEAARADAEAAQAAAERKRAEAESKRAEAESARAEAESARAKEESKRRRTSLALAASVLMLVGLGSGGWLYMTQQEANRQTAEAATQRLHATEMQDLAEQREKQRDAAKEAEATAEEAKDEAKKQEALAIKRLEEQTEQAKEASKVLFAYGVAEYEAGRLESGVEKLIQARALRADNDQFKQRYEQVIVDRLTRGNRSWATMHHKDGLNHVAFSPDGGRIATASSDRTARLWDAQTGVPLGEPMKHEDNVTCVVFSPDGSRIATASWDETARLWDAQTGAPLGETMKHDERVNCIAFSPDGSRIATTTCFNTRIWEVRTGAPLGKKMYNHSEVVNGEEGFVAFSPDGSIIAATSSEVVCFWDAKTSAPMGTELAHDRFKRVNYFAFSPDGSRIVTASHDKTSRIWDAQTGASLGDTMKHDDRVNFAVFSPDGSRIATASWDKTARLWDAQTGTPLGEQMKHDAAVLQVAFSPDGSGIATASWDKSARIWDAQANAPLGETMKHDEHVSCIAFSPDGSRIASASFDKTARLWDVQTGAQLGETMKHDDFVRYVAFSRDGGRIATVSGDKTARLWDAQTGAPLGDMMRHDYFSLPFAFSPDFSRVAAVSLDNTARLWNAQTGAPLGETMKHFGDVDRVAFSPDGTRIATTSKDKTARLWDAQTGASLGEPMKHDAAVTYVTFSTDGSRIATASLDETARVWDAQTGAPLGEQMKHDAAVSKVAFSPDGSRIVTVSRYNRARTWDAHTGDSLGEIKEDYGILQCVVFSPDGSRVATVSQNKAARVWDAQMGAPLGEPMRHEKWVSCVAFSPDGSRIVTASEDGKVCIWDSERLLPNNPLAEITHFSAPNDSSLPRNLEFEDHLRIFVGRKQFRYRSSTAIQAIAKKSWFAAKFHLPWLCEQEPDNPLWKKLQDEMNAAISISGK